MTQIGKVVCEYLRYLSQKTNLNPEYCPLQNIMELVRIFSCRLAGPPQSKKFFTGKFYKDSKHVPAFMSFLY